MSKNGTTTVDTTDTPRAQAVLEPFTSAAAAVAILLLASVVAALADELPAPDQERADYCDSYAKNVARMLIPMVIQRARSTCGNAEVYPGPPLPKDWIEALHLVDPKLSCAVDVSRIGIVPATDRPKAPAASAPPPSAPPVSKPPASASAPAAKAVASSTSGPAGYCASAHRKIVWSGKSWRCV